MDSGAAEAVCSAEDFAAFNIEDDPKRKNHGVEYVCADGNRIPNLGEKKVSGYTDEGSKLSVTYQVAPVDRPILAVCKLTQAGHNVWFGKEGGIITHGTTGRRTHFKRKGGIYILEVWVPVSAPPDGCHTIRMAPLSGGIRQ